MGAHLIFGEFVVSEEDRILFTSPLRRRCREVETDLQAAIEERDRVGGTIGDMSPIHFRVLRQYRVPEWAHGVRVERAGVFQHAVVATENRGR